MFLTSIGKLSISIDANTYVYNSINYKMFKFSWYFNNFYLILSSLIIGYRH